MGRIAVVMAWAIVASGTSALDAAASPLPVSMQQDTTKEKKGKKGDGEAKRPKPARTPLSASYSSDAVSPLMAAAPKSSRIA